MDKLFKILIVEDVATDAELVSMELENNGVYHSYDRVETKEDFLYHLKNCRPDIILSDYSLPRFSALDALSIKNEVAPSTPFILVTGNQTEEIAVHCIKQGADDYILKNRLGRLPIAVTNAIQKKKAEEAGQKAIEDLKASEEKYRNLFENSVVGMFSARMNDCCIAEANEKAKEILGVTELKGLHFDNFFACESGTLSEQFTDGKKSIENFEVQLSKPNGDKIWVSISARIFEKEGIIEGIIHDITHSKNSYVELEKVNYELDRFTYHASHDLRSPLRSLEGLIQAALEEDVVEEIQICLKMMQRSTNKLNNLIDDLLSLAYSKKTEAKINPVDFYQELQDSLGQVAFANNAIKIHSQVEQDATFLTDGVRLRIILNNLISNAIKYHNLNQPEPSIHISIHAGSEKAIIVIRDNGKGIAEKHVNKIFDMFYRADTSSEGSGLGLYLVKNTIEKLSGTIHLESKTGEGTCFTIEIPNLKVNTKARIISEVEQNLNG